METCCEYTEKTLFVSSDHQKWINRIRKLSEQYPDDVTIKHRPEENDGCICATMPSEWLRISPPRKVEMSEERKAELSERLRMARKKQKT
jgi:hypothetical protein